MKQTIKILAVTLALSSLGYASDATVPSEDPAARLQRIISEAQAEATRIAAKTKDERVAELRAQVAAVSYRPLSSEIAIASLGEARIIGSRYIKLLYSIDDRTEQLTAELDLMRKSLRLAYTEHSDASREATALLTAERASVASLTQANTEKDAEIAALKAQLAVEKAENAEHKLWRGLILKTQELLAAENAYMTNLRQAPNPLDAEGGDAE